MKKRLINPLIVLRRIYLVIEKSINIVHSFKIVYFSTSLEKSFNPKPNTGFYDRALALLFWTSYKRYFTAFLTFDKIYIKNMKLEIKRPRSRVNGKSLEISDFATRWEKSSLPGAWSRICARRIVERMKRDLALAQLFERVLNVPLPRRAEIYTIIKL